MFERLQLIVGNLVWLILTLIIDSRSCDVLSRYQPKAKWRPFTVHGPTADGSHPLPL